MKNQKGNMSVIVSFVIVVGVIGLVIFSLMHRTAKENPLEGIKGGSSINEKSQTNDQTLKENQASQSQEKVMNQNTKTLAGFVPVSKVSKLETLDIIKGSGEEAKSTDTVSVHYTGAVAATGVIFQSSKDFGSEPVTFPLSQVIKGWTLGIPGMKVGGTRRLVIPAEMAYAANPPQGSGIPANADLVFDVELVEIN
jgi:FKBP-type peptidyl-prolyl cis-trans isomerase